MSMRTSPIGRTAVAMPACAVGGCTVAVGTSAAGTATMAMARHFGSSLGVGGAAAGGAHRVGTGSAHDKLALDTLPCAADKACWAGGVVAGPEFDSGVILRTLSGKGFFDQLSYRRRIGGGPFDGDGRVGVCRLFSFIRPVLDKPRCRWVRIGFFLSAWKARIAVPR